MDRAGARLKAVNSRSALSSDEPVSIHRIELRFHEADYERTQEFILRWSSESGGSATEIVRQQWNFSPTDSTTEIEYYVVDLDAVSVLELAIRPDLRRPEAVAGLASLRLGLMPLPRLHCRHCSVFDVKHMSGCVRLRHPHSARAVYLSLLRAHPPTAGNDPQSHPKYIRFRRAEQPSP
jgi:hypothetical protein